VPILICALKHGIERAFVETLLCELRKVDGPALAEWLTHPDTEAQRYARELLPPEASLIVETTASSQILYVTCLGDFQVTCGGRQVGEPGWLATKAGDLFAYFVTFRDSNVARDRVLEALWPEVAPERSSGAFHTALYKMRQMLRMGGCPGKFVRVRSGEYCLEKDIFWIDVQEFRQLNDQCSRHSHEAMDRCELCIERLQRAVDLYRGDYLGNLYYDWVLDEQRDLRRMYLKALRVLADHYAGQGDCDTATVYGRQILSQDPLLEDVHRQMMCYHSQLGDRNKVMRQYRWLGKVLADELGAEPMPETQELYRSLMGGEIR
jgi:two-component SAPR family response regulator